jgi:hypothetical protein
MPPLRGWSVAIQSVPFSDDPGTKTINNQRSTISNSFSLTALLRGEMNFPWQSG